MPQFSYSAFDATGKTVKGEVSAQSELAALDHIARDNLIPIKIEQGGSALKWWQRELSFGGAQSARPQVLARLFQMLSIMLNAHFPLTKALSFCAAQIGDQKVVRLLVAAERKVADGDTLSIALSDAAETIPNRYLRAIEMGEAANQLGPVVEQLGAGLREEQAIRREIKQALVYPIILILMSVLVVCLLVFYLTPTLVPVFQSSQAEPPLILSSMEALRLLITSNWLVVLLTGLGIGLALSIWRARLAGQLVRTLRHMPGVKGFIVKNQSLVFCQTLLQYLSAGDRVQTAIEQSRLAFADPAWVSLLTRAHEQIVDGKTLSSALNQSALLDPLALAMIEAGEEGDQLQDTLATIVATLRDQTKQSLAQAVKLITPMLTLVIGLCVGAVIMSTISAILDLNDIAF